MKKLLKSFLIATASIGIIAGSTAAVVSCGENTEVTPQDDYNKQVDTVVKAVGTIASPIQLAAEDSQDAVKTKIAAAITAYITDHTADLPLLATTVDKTAISLDGTGPNTSGTPAQVTNSVTVTIPVKGTPAGIVATASQPTTMTFNVTPPPTADYTSALGAITTHFSGTTGVDLFSATTTQMATTDIIKGLIQTSIFAYIGLPSSTAGALTAAQKAALKSGLVATDIVVTIHGTLPAAAGAQVTDGTNNISVDIPAATGDTSKDTVLTAAKYTVLKSPEQLAYEAAITDIQSKINLAIDAYVMQWKIPGNCPDGITATTMQKAAIETALNSNNNIINFWKSDRVYVGSGGRAEAADIIAAINTATTNNVISGVLKVTVDQTQVNFGAGGHFSLNYTFAPFESSLNPVSFNTRINIYN